MYFPRSKNIFLTLLAALLLAGFTLHAQRRRIANATHNATVQDRMIDHAIQDTASGMDEDDQEAQDTVPVTNDTIASDAAATVPSADDPYASREEKIRSAHRQLYDSLVPDENAREGIDYATIWSRQLPADAAKTLRSKKEFNYETTSKPPPKFLVALLGLLSGIFTPVLYVLLGIILLFGILYILRNNDIKLFARKPKTVALPEVAEVTEDIHSSDFQQLLEQAIHAGNWTAGVRYLYLYTLQQLQRKGLIHLGPDKTNRDYLHDLANTRWHKDFSMLTMDYEYVCYGNFPLSQRDFDLIRQQFNAFKNELGPS
ncbi:MAG TPA: DUF4129 domain-containing protein [Chitinophaga sp.]